jgi:hypothetical protein
VSRSAVGMTRLLTRVAGRSSWMLKLLFAQAARGVPLVALTDSRPPRWAPPINLPATGDEPEHALRRSYGNSGS